MRKYITVLGIIGIGFGVIMAATAQKPQKPQKKKVTFKGKSFLYDGLARTGKISKKQFDSLLAYPLIARDSSNTARQVVLFTFSYAERGMYEDSTGIPRIMTDYYNTESVNGKLPEDWIASIRARSKQGDTALFYDVMAQFPDSLRTRFYAEPLKLIITD